MTDLNTAYLDLLRPTDDEAVAAKRRRAGFWAVHHLAHCLLLATGVLGVAGVLAGWSAGFDHAVKEYGLTGLHALGLAAVLSNMYTAPRSRWLSRRAAVEKLREHTMLFRAAAGPYHGADAEGLFRSLLARTAGEMSPPRWGWRVVATWLFLLPFRLPVPWRLRDWLGRQDARFREALTTRPRPADDPTGDHPSPRFADLPPSQAVRVAVARLDGQEWWHRNKTGVYFRRYLRYRWWTFFVLAVASVWNLTAGHSYWAVLIPGFVGIVLNGIVEFCEYLPITTRYVQVAEGLSQLRERHAAALERLARHGPADEFRVRLRQFVEDTERLLGAAFTAWNLTLDAIPNDV